MNDKDIAALRATGFATEGIAAALQCGAGPRSMPLDIPDRVAALEQRVQALEMNQVDISHTISAQQESLGMHRRIMAQLLHCIQELGRIAGIPRERLGDIPPDPDDLPPEAVRPDTPASEVPPT